MSKRRFELVAGKSAKFWEVTVKGSEVTVRFGRIGTTGATRNTDLETSAAARKQYDGLIRQKLAWASHTTTSTWFSASTGA